MSSSFRVLARSAVVLAVGSCMPLPMGSSGGGRSERAPSGPPAARGQSCVIGRTCEAGLTCVDFVSTIGNQATCEIVCGDGGACDDGMTCGTRHDFVSGPGARNVCL